ncbi:hypothetical protein HYALB_00007292 [Hymenoscyphus albidus]|uniref:Uncharacterized protein n=1 Tax=Hymenoscyphus albidus TaxID=595503 RepID=A0A9N9QCN2_9HELO|nr:hypothetical protein HYALB_00007292 [Hymenoscyphus albidus]
MLSPFFLVLLLLPLTCTTHQIPLIPSPESSAAKDKFGADPIFARQRASNIFNAIHSSMRQWGSSLQHNGMSYFPATIPENTHLYHGTHQKERVKGMEWLAFEIEHAEAFARWGAFRPPKNSYVPGSSGEYLNSELPSFGLDEDSVKHRYTQTIPPPQNDRPKGYLHIYRTTRDLTKLLYIDGMSAGKTSNGTLDTTDIVLRNDTRPKIPVWGDVKRGEDLCAIGLEWGVEGFILMEVGFELILCDFEDGLILESSRQKSTTKESDNSNMWRFEWFRGVAARYQGITAGRVELDDSSMVSAYFYPLNLTNPDVSHSEQPRLVSSDKEGIVRLKTDLRRIIQESQSQKHVKINWQGVVDMIVSRYTDRLVFIKAEGASHEQILSVLESLLGIFIDYENPNIVAAENLCAVHYLTSVIPSTSQDTLIYEALLTVTKQICNTLFEVRKSLLEAEEDQASTVEEAKSKIGILVDYLNWSTWLDCGKCAYDEVCYVAASPWGRPQDYYHPGCLKHNETWGLDGYWEDKRIAPDNL